MNNVSITPYEQIQKLRAIDDIMFQMLAESEKVCQEILRVILDDAKLIVQKLLLKHQLLIFLADQYD